MNPWFGLFLRLWQRPSALVGYQQKRELEAARKKITFMTNGLANTVDPGFRINQYQKPVGVKMGSGKGPDSYVAVVKPGMVLFELGGVTEEIARTAFDKAGHKLSIKTAFVEK